MEFVLSDVPDCCDFDSEFDSGLLMIRVEIKLPFFRISILFISYGENGMLSIIVFVMLRVGSLFWSFIEFIKTFEMSF